MIMETPWGPGFTSADCMGVRGIILVGLVSLFSVRFLLQKMFVVKQCGRASDVLSTPSSILQSVSDLSFVREGFGGIACCYVRVLMRRYTHRPRISNKIVSVLKSITE